MQEDVEQPQRSATDTGTDDNKGSAKSERKTIGQRMGSMGRAGLSASLLVPAALTCCAVSFAISHYSPLSFDPSQYQAQAKTKAPSAQELKTTKVDESKRSTTTQSAAQKVKASESKDFTMSTPSGGYKDGTYTANSYGYRSYITVQVVIKNGKIDSVKVLSENEDRPYYSNATAVIARVMSKQSTDVDTVSGATYSSRGILAAVKRCLQKAAISKKEKAKKVKENKPRREESANDEEEESWNAPDNDSTDGEDGKDESYTCTLYANGRWEGSGEGYSSKEGAGVPITLAVTTLNDKITKITVLRHREDNPYFRQAKNGVLAQIMSTQGTDGIDTVSGATYSSKGLISAVRNALAKASAALEKKNEDADGGEGDGASSDDAAENGDGQESEGDGKDAGLTAAAAVKPEGSR